MTKLRWDGEKLLWSSHFGGYYSDDGLALALDATGGAAVVGRTSSWNLPATAGASDTTHNGGSDGFVARFDLLPRGVSTFGRSTPGCVGPLVTTVTGMPRVGNVEFGLICGGASGSAPGLLMISGRPLQSPLVLYQAEIWVDPTAPLFVVLPVASSAEGLALVPLPIAPHPDLAAVLLHAQFAWFGPTGPPPCPPSGVSASPALRIVVQP